MLENRYNPTDVEERLYQAWEASGAFRAGNKPNGKPFTIVIPPPNVTGSLHIGHALLSLAVPLSTAMPAES